MVMSDEMQAERDQLARWKAEALPVIFGLQDLGRALDLPLGEGVTGPAALTAVRNLLDRLAAAEAALTWIASDAPFDGADDPEDAMQERARMALEAAQRPNGAAGDSECHHFFVRRLCDDFRTCQSCGEEFPITTNHDSDEGRQR